MKYPKENNPHNTDIIHSPIISVRCIHCAGVLGGIHGQYILPQKLHGCLTQYSVKLYDRNPRIPETIEISQCIATFFQCNDPAQ